VDSSKTADWWPQTLPTTMAASGVDDVRGQHRGVNWARVYPLVDQVLDKEQFWPRVAQAEIGDSPSARRPNDSLVQEGIQWQ
jgi:hypothetical protein